MAVTMMKVRVMTVGMHETIVAMRMAVWFAGRIIR